VNVPYYMQYWCNYFCVRNVDDLQVHKVLGAHPAFYPISTRNSLAGNKTAGREANHSPPTGAEVNTIWIYTSVPPVRIHGAVRN
jgi:hypothetical protein